MARSPNELLHGTLDVLILKSLVLGPLHGYDISRRIEERSRAFSIEDAALYKALYRLEEAGAIDATWGVSDSNRRAKFYRLTPAGRRLLTAESRTFREYAAAVLRVLDAAAEDA
ncbi:MAG: PadR family transcriptional regulator [Gemmatimonadetes bacterium]|nr:PadR family transcriptional regulator [Gemmatimonadota bacterium]